MQSGGSYESNLSQNSLQSMYDGLKHNQYLPKDTRIHQRACVLPNENRAMRVYEVRPSENESSLPILST